MIYFLMTAAIVVIDQLSKRLMSQWLGLCEVGACEVVDVLPGFQLVVVHNTGAAFSFLADAGGWQRWFLTTVSLVVSIVIAVWMIRLKSNEKLLALSLSLILGGALGNLIDRAFQGYVVDFLLFYYDDWYFPAFNVADSSVSVGAALMILDVVLSSRRDSSQVAEDT